MGKKDTAMIFSAVLTMYALQGLMMRQDDETSKPSSAAAAHRDPGKIRFFLAFIENRATTGLSQL